MDFNQDQVIILFTTIGLTILLPLLLVFLTTERFYDFKINRWKPGVNLPSLSDMQGKELDFKKFQRDVRIYSFAFIQGIVFCILPLAFVAEGSTNYIWVMAASMSVIGILSIWLIIFTFKVFPKWGKKYIKKA